MFDSPFFAVLVFLLAAGVIVWIVWRQREGLPARPMRGSGADASKMFRSGFERALIGLAYGSVDGNWIDVNAKLLALLGYTREEFLEKTSIRTITHPDDRKREASLMADLRLGKHGGYTVNKRLLRSDREYQPFRVDVVRCSDSNGGTCYQFAVSEVEESQVRHDICSAFDDINEVSIIRMDAAGMITDWNRGAQTLYGHRSAEMIDKPWARLHDRHNRHTPTQLLEIAARAGVFDGTERRVRSDAAVISVNARIIPQYAGRELSGFVEIARDATVARSAIEYRDAYERMKALTDQRIRELTEQASALRDDRHRYKQAEDILRAEVDSLRAINQEIQSKNRVLGAALRKMLDRRREIELEREREAQRRVESEVGEDGLPSNLGWQEFTSGSEVSDVIVQMTHAKMTGTLAVRSGSMEKRFYFENGHVVSCGSNHPALLLGDLLVDRSIIDHSQRERILEVQRESGMSFGRLLVLLGMISEPQLEVVLSEKIEREIRDLLSWREGEFAFVEGTGLSQRIVPVKVEVAPIITVASANASVEEDRIVLEAALAYASDETRRNGAASAEQRVEGESVTERGAAAAQQAGSGAEAAPADAGLPAVVMPDIVVPQVAPRLYIARKKGKSKKYHAPECIAARSTPDNARANFDSREAAEAKGYEPCAQCVLREGVAKASAKAATL